MESFFLMVIGVGVFILWWTIDLRLLEIRDEIRRQKDKQC